jgi:predicted HTH transcriptional regulator
MIENLETLLAEISNGKAQEHRHENIELKQSWKKDYGQDASALGNKIDKQCCWLIVGVKDNGILHGLIEKQARQIEQTISQQVNEYLDPVQACMQIYCCEINKNWIVIIQIKNPGDVVYWENRAYVASGTTSRELNPAEILELRIKLPGLTDYSNQPIYSQYDTSLIYAFSNKIGENTNTIDIENHCIETLQKLQIYHKQAARILFGNCRFRLIKYNQSSEPIANEQYQGLYKILTDEFQEEIQKWTAKQLNIDTHPFPENALKESLSNAVAHAAYFEDDGDIIIELYPDHLSISNLCIQESIYFANKWFARSHKTINSVLMEVLRIADHVDELGRGKNVIFSESIRHGKQEPEVFIEKAGKCNRWKLLLYGGSTDEVKIRLLSRIKECYKDDQKSLIAFSLVLWRDKKVKEIRNYVDGDFSRQFAEVLSSLNGPIFYDKQEDKIVLTRWARVLLGEGRDSKVLSSSEEKWLKELAYTMCTKLHNNEITPKRLRSFSQMGNTSSEQSLSSKILTQWHGENLLKKVAQGKYRWVQKPEDYDNSALVQHLRELLETGKSSES